MIIRIFLSLFAVLCVAGFFSTYATAAQIDRSLTSTKTSGGRLDPSSYLNAFFQGQEKATRQTLQQNLNIITARLGKETHAQELGFGTDPKSATIAPDISPLLLFHVGLKSLRKFTPDKEASDLLMFTNQLIFPVSINNKVKSSVTVRLLEAHEDLKNKKRGWRITRWGFPSLLLGLMR